MRTRVQVWLVAAASVLVAGDARAAAGGVQCARVAEARRSVLVLLRGGTVVGSGFLYGDHRTVATAEHVASAGPNRAQDLSGRSYRLALVAVDERRDLALMALDRDAGGAPLRPAAEPVVGMRAFAIGHPRVIDGRRYEPLTRWTVSGGSVGGVDADWVAADATVYPGNSGGPLIDCDGRVLGVASHGPDDLRVAFFGRAGHLDALRGGRDGPRYRVPVEPGRTVDIGAVAGHELFGASLGVTWRFEGGWLLRFAGSAGTNAASADIFGAGQRTAATAGLFGGVAFRPFRGWRASTMHVEPTLGLVVERDTVRRPIVDGDGSLAAETSTDLTPWGAGALRIQLGRWFVEPQIAVSLESDPEVRWLVTVGLALDL